MTDDIPYLDLTEFREIGLLQEINRRLLHPAGLALEMRLHSNGEVELGGVWDYRSDPEGMVFTPGTIDEEKIARVDALIAEHAEQRRGLFGAVVQKPDSPIPPEEPVEGRSVYDAWWAIKGRELRDALQRAADGQDPDLVYAELFANSETEDYR